MTDPNRFDFILMGAGLANGLIALELLRARPDLRVALVERDTKAGGNHTWSFHEGDVPPAMRATVEPLMAARWEAHDVSFPGRRRRLGTGYASVLSYDLDQAVQRAFAERPASTLILGTGVRRANRHGVELEDGRRLEARAVLDGRGPDASAPHQGGYQKFLGLELRLKTPAPRTLPLLMDATVPQLDGFRFVYVLPFEPHRVLIEDTYYSLSATLDRIALRERILGYAEERGYEVAEILREEVGVLPIPTRRGPAASADAAVAVGARGHWFHPTTGYSFPSAARVASFLAEHEPEAVHGPAFLRLRESHERQARFARWLNRLLFGAFAPAERFHVLERFYGLPEETITRFYRLDSTTLDRSRILCGRPPRGFSVLQLLAGDATT